MTRRQPRSIGSSLSGPASWREGSSRPEPRFRPRSRPGYLVFNPLGVPRRVAVILPDAALDLRPEGPLRAAQFTDEGVCAVVDLPAFGFAWVPREPNLERAASPARGTFGPGPLAQERDDRGRDRRGHGRNPRRHGGWRGHAQAGPAARHDGPGEFRRQGRSRSDEVRSLRCRLRRPGPGSGDGVGRDRRSREWTEPRPVRPALPPLDGPAGPGDPC